MFDQKKLKRQKTQVFMIFVKIFTKMEKNFKRVCSKICIQPIV